MKNPHHLFLYCLLPCLNQMATFTYSIPNIYKKTSASSACGRRVHHEALLSGRWSFGVVTIRNSSYLASIFSAGWCLTISSVDRSGSAGKYTCRATNQFGISEATFEVILRGDVLLSSYLVFRFQTGWCLLKCHNRMAKYLLIKQNVRYYHMLESGFMTIKWWIF